MVIVESLANKRVEYYTHSPLCRFEKATIYFKTPSFPHSLDANILTGQSDFQIECLYQSS